MKLLMIPFAPIRARLLITLLLAVALVGAGFAHKTRANDLSPELADYLAAGGALADICGALDGQDLPMSQDCEACRLVDTVSLSDALGIRPVVLLPKARVHCFVAKRLRHITGPDPARRTRAPPQA